MTDYFMIFISVVLLAAGFVLQRYYQDCSDNGNAGVRFSITAGMFSIGIMIVMNGFSAEFSWYSLINALLKALAVFIYTLLGFWLMKQGKMVLYTLFLMSGGMLLPAIWGWCFLGDPIVPQRVIGTIVILFAIAISNMNIGKIDIKILTSCLGVFFLNGCVSILSKLHQSNTVYQIVSTTGYALYSAVLSLILSSTYLFIMHAKEQQKTETISASSKKRQLWLIGIVAVYSLIGTVSSLLQLEGAKNLPASVLYPMITGGSVVLMGLFSLLFFKEKPSKKEWIGIGLCLFGTLLFL